MIFRVELKAGGVDEGEQQDGVGGVGFFFDGVLDGFEVLGEVGFDLGGGEGKWFVDVAVEGDEACGLIGGEARGAGGGGERGGRRGE